MPNRTWPKHKWEMQVDRQMPFRPSQMSRCMIVEEESANTQVDKEFEFLVAK